jgi:hypothetical protein
MSQDDPGQESEPLSLETILRTAQVYRDAALRAYLEKDPLYRWWAFDGEPNASARYREWMVSIGCSRSAVLRAMTRLTRRKRLGP